MLNSFRNWLANIQELEKETLDNLLNAAVVKWWMLKVNYKVTTTSTWIPYSARHFHSLLLLSLIWTCICLLDDHSQEVEQCLKIFKFINDRRSYHIETSYLIWIADQLTGFHMGGRAFIAHGLNRRLINPNPNFPLHKPCEKTGFYWPVFSRIKTEYTILSSYGKLRASENPSSSTFYAKFFFLSNK